MGDFEIGDWITGRCTTHHRSYTGVITEIVRGSRYPADAFQLYKITATGKTYSDGTPITPIVEAAERGPVGTITITPAGDATCSCGNTADQEGFPQCQADGTILDEDDPPSSWDGHIGCVRCQAVAAVPAVQP